MTSKACLVAATCGIMFAGANVWAVEPSTEQLKNDVAELRSQVTQLQAMEARNNRETAATVEQVLRDAERRTQLMAAGTSGAGYDNGFYIRSGEFLLKPGINFQFRNITDYRENTGGAKNDEVENGFELRRVQFMLGGTAFTKDLTYFVKWNTEREGGSLYLEDAFVTYMFADDWGARVGQWKAPFSHEKMASDSKTMAVERSLLDATLGGGWSDRVQGASLVYGNYNRNNPLNAELALTDGANSDNTNYVGHYPSDPAPLGNVGAPSGHEWDFGVVGRVEYKVMGDWKDYSTYGAAGLKDQLLVLGGGVEWNQGGNGDEVGGTVDILYKHPCGAGLYGGAIVRNIDSQLSATGSNFTDWGLVLQASYAINPAWEPFVRWAWINYDDNVVLSGGSTEDSFHEICVGVNYYLGNNGSAGNHAKVTVDLTWLPNGSPGKLSGQGYLGDSDGSDEVVVRGQFQLSL